MEKKTLWQRSEDYAKKVSGELIEQIKKGTAPWQKPWKPGESFMPQNFSTGKPYTGGNALYLMSRGIRDGRADNRWGTYNQIAEAGGQVRKGEKGTQVLFFKDKTARAVKDENGKIVKDGNGKTVYDEEKRAFPVCKQYTVFSVEQADGLKLLPREGQGRLQWDAHRDAEKIIEAAGPKVQHVPGDRAYYRVSDDKIVLPEPSQFPDPERVLPDGAARVRTLYRPSRAHEPRDVERGHRGGLWITRIRPRRIAGRDQRHDDRRARRSRSRSAARRGLRRELGCGARKRPA